MTRSFVAHSIASSALQAGEEIGEAISAGFNGEAPDALVVFASSRHDYAALLGRIQDIARPAAMIGCSSAGEFTSHAFQAGAVSAVALRSDTMRFNPVLGRGLRQDRHKAAQAMAAAMEGMRSHQHAYRSALVLTDALAGHADDFVEQLTLLTAGSYQLFGGGAGDDANFTRTHVFMGTEAVPDAAVALEILSDKPVGIGVRHGWMPGSPPFRVTEADGMRLISLNNMPAVEAFRDYAQQTGQQFDPSDPIPFFLHNVIGIATPVGFRLRVPLSVDKQGAIACAADIPIGAKIHIMAPKTGSALAATEAAMEQMQGAKAGAALFFDCVATRLRMGQEFGSELDEVKRRLDGVSYAGCNTYGQIARAEGQFSGFHNCTAVVAVLPD
jgi:hypothetical protein